MSESKSTNDKKYTLLNKRAVIFVGSLLLFLSLWDALESVFNIPLSDFIGPLDEGIAILFVVSLVYLLITTIKPSKDQKLTNKNSIKLENRPFNRIAVLSGIITYLLCSKYKDFVFYKNLSIEKASDILFFVGLVCFAFLFIKKNLQKKQK